MMCAVHAGGVWTNGWYLLIVVLLLGDDLAQGACLSCCKHRAEPPAYRLPSLPCPPARPQLAGVGTNLLAGLMGAKWGIKSTLLTGLSMQLVGIGMLFAWQVRRLATCSAVPLSALRPPDLQPAAPPL